MLLYSVSDHRRRHDYLQRHEAALGVLFMRGDPFDLLLSIVQCPCEEEVILISNKSVRDITTDLRLAIALLSNRAAAGPHRLLDPDMTV